MAAADPDPAPPLPSREARTHPGAPRRRGTRVLTRKLGLLVVALGLALGLIELGLRGTATLLLRERGADAAPARPGQIRVLCLGESTTADPPLDRAWPAELERILARQLERRVRVMNRAVPATTTPEILERLPEQLDRLQPDVVVAMMGINDGGSLDPTLRVGGSLRVWKLIQTGYWSLRARFASADSGPVLLRVAAAREILAGRLATAEPMVERLVALTADAEPGVRARAFGLLAVLRWQQGRPDEAERAWAEYRRLDLDSYLPVTVESHATLQRLLDERDIPLVAVAYPGRPLEGLRRMLWPDAKLVLVDSERAFVERIRRHPAARTYSDLFAGAFGHLEPAGHRVLAERVALGVLRALRNGRESKATEIAEH